MIAGVIEGFYGTPWTTAERLSCIETLDAYGANAYVWAGKSEPRHRDHWRDAFTDDELGSTVAGSSSRKASETLIENARYRARGKGDNCTFAIVKLTDPAGETHP